MDFQKDRKKLFLIVALAAFLVAFVLGYLSSASKKQSAAPAVTAPQGK